MEPLDLCVRPHLCMKCKSRFWTAQELETHMSFTHKTRSSVISHTRMCGDSPGVLFNQELSQLPQNSSEPLHPGSAQIPNTTSHFPTSILQTFTVGEGHNPYSNVPCNQRLNQLSHNSCVSLQPGLAQVPDNTNSHMRIVGTKEFPTSFSVPFSQGLNQLRPNSSISCHLGSVHNAKNAMSVPENIFHNLIVKESKATNSLNISLNQGQNELLENSSVSLRQEQVQVPYNTTATPVNTSLRQEQVQVPYNTTATPMNTSLRQKQVQVPYNTTSTPVNTSHEQLIENQIPNLTSSQFNQELGRLSQNPSGSLDLGFVQMPDKMTSFSTSILNSLIVGEYQNPYSLNQKLNKLSQNPSISLHPVLVQEPYNTASIQTNISPMQTIEAKRVSKSPIVQCNQGSNQLPQNSISPSVQMPDNTTSIPSRNVYSFIAGESQNLFSYSPLLNPEPNQLPQNSNASSPLVLVQEAKYQTSNPENISYMQITGNNPTPHSPSISFNQTQTQLSQNSNVSLILSQSGLVQVQDNNTLLQANNSHSWIVGASPNSYSPRFMFNQAPCELFQHSSVSMQPRSAQIPDTTNTLQRERVVKKRKVNMNKKTV